MYCRTGATEANTDVRPEFYPQIPQIAQIHALLPLFLGREGRGEEAWGTELDREDGDCPKWGLYRAESDASAPRDCPHLALAQTVPCFRARSFPKPLSGPASERSL